MTGRHSTRKALSTGVLTVTAWVVAAAGVQAQEPTTGLVVRGAQGGALTLAAQTLEFSRSILIENLDTATHAGVRLETTGLDGPGTGVVAATWTTDGAAVPDTLTFAGLASRTLVLSADLPRGGEYVGHLTLIYGGRRHTTALRVTRSRRALAVAITGGANADGAAGFFRGPHPVIRFTVRDTAGMSVPLRTPTLETLGRGEGAARTGAVYDSAVFTPAADPAAAQATPPGEGAQPADTRTLPRDGTLQWQLTLPGIGKAGNYGGTVTLEADGYREARHDISFQIKHAGWKAAFFIFMGVLGSALLRRYFANVKPLLQQQRKVAYLREDWKEIQTDLGDDDVTDHERTVLSRLRRSLEDLDVELIRGTVGAGFDDTLRDLNQKLTVFPMWVTGRRQVEAVEPAEIRPQLQPTLDKAEDFLLQEDASQDVANQAIQALTGLPEAIRKALAEHATGAITRLEKDVDDRIAAASGTSLANELTNRVKPEIERARKLAAEGKHEAATQSLEKARGLLAGALADELRAEMARPFPPGFDAASWSDLGRRVKGQLDAIAGAPDAEASLAAYQKAHTTYLDGVVNGLKERLDQVRRALPHNTTLQDAEKKALETRLTAIEDTANRAVQELAGNRNAEARTLYVQAVAALDKETQLFKQHTLGAGGADLAGAGSAIEGGGAARVGPVVAVRERARRLLPSAELSSRLRLFDNAADLALFLIATLTGVLILWAGNATWGSGTDYLTAFLWGLGVHEVGGAAMDFANLRQKFGG